tara:strand:+ start:764 stop:988 length:225 start_codon:yes stop_codon:yes gene_type:complete
MGHVFRAKSFIQDPTANTDSVEGTMAAEVENYLEAADAGGSSTDIDEVISVASCRLKGDRVFTIVVLEDDIAGG